MGLFKRTGKGRAGTVRDGVPGTAVLIDFERRDFSDEHTPANSNATEVHLANFGIGSYTYRFELEVTLEGSQKPYIVNEKFSVPPKAGNGINTGMTLKVLAEREDPNVLELDWDAWFAPGGDGERLTWGTEEIHAEVHDAMPDATRQMMIDGWVAACKGGQMTREAFDQAIDGALGGGMLSPEEAAEARARI